MEAVGSIKPIVIANATTVAVVGFVLCPVLSYLIPDILFAIRAGSIPSSWNRSEPLPRSPWGCRCLLACFSLL